MKRMQRRRRGLAALAVAALVAASASSSLARIWPAWTIAGPRVLDVSPGFASLAGSWTFSLPNGEGDANLSINYDVKARLGAAGLFTDAGGNPTIFSLLGTYSVDAATGVQHVKFTDAVKNPQFTFTGDVSADATSIVGTFVRKSGYFEIAGDDSDALTLHRAGAAPATAIKLTIATRMDDHGRIFGSPTTVDGKTVESRAQALLYGTHFVKDHFEDNVATGGLVRGTVKTRANGTSTGQITIKGPKWSAKFKGVVDAAGFHALCDFSAGGFVAKKLPITLAVTPGPTPPPPVGGTKPPPNLLDNCVATVINGAVVITRSSVPSKFFGTTAGLRIEFPQADWYENVNGHAIHHADPSDASLPAPNARRCIVTIGSTVYGTATSPADVTLDVDRFDVIAGQQIRLLATGTVATGTGKKKTVDVLVQATVQ